MSAEINQILGPYLPTTLPSPNRFQAYAPSNIALSKYWGKRDAKLNLPLNSSLSISLANWGSTTTIAPSESGKDVVFFEGEALPETDKFAAKIIRFIDLFRREQNIPVQVETSNTIPTAAGLASSASGFAALTKAVNGAFGLNLEPSVQSMISRLGSGSATRSFWHGFVRWDMGTDPNGTDSFAQPLDISWPDFCIAIVPVNTGPKSQSSRDGMNHTVATSPLFSVWPKQAEKDCAAIESTVLQKDFTTLGQLAEANALAMHATMMAARPALTYLLPESWQALQSVWRARNEGVEVYATMDAGANVKLLFQKGDLAEVQKRFASANFIEPFSY